MLTSVHSSAILSLCVHFNKPEGMFCTLSVSQCHGAGGQCEGHISLQTLRLAPKLDAALRGPLGAEVQS